MKNSLWLTAIVLSSILILPACDKKQHDRMPDSESRPSATGTPSAPPTKISNFELEKAIRAKLESDDALKQAQLSVSADVKDNKATISGTVASQEMRAKAVDLAKSAQPGITIEEQIEVKPAA